MIALPQYSAGLAAGFVKILFPLLCGGQLAMLLVGNNDPESAEIKTHLLQVREAKA
jgi:hypothetical protein